MDSINISSSSSSSESSTDYETWNILPPSVRGDYLLTYGEILFKIATPLDVVYHHAEARTSEIKLLEYNVPMVKTSGIGILEAVVIYDDSYNRMQDMDP